MKYFAIFTMLLLAGCSKPTAKSEDPPSYTHAWVMTGPMDGFMGVAIALTTNEFHYWFYSDVKMDNEPVYPITGAYTFDGKHLHLQSDAWLYSTNWNVVTKKGLLFLDSVSNPDESRLLSPNPKFDPDKPFSWKQLLEAEQKN